MMDRFVLKFVVLLGMLAIVGPRISVAWVVPTLQSQCEKAGYQVACMDSTCKTLVCGNYNQFLKKYFITGNIPIESGSVCGRNKVCLAKECREIQPYMKFKYVGDTTVSICHPIGVSYIEDDHFTNNNPSYRTMVETPDTQCKRLGYSVACRYRNDHDWAEFGCKRLLCGVEVERGVYYQMYDKTVPVAGTRCGRNRACIGGKCTLIRSTLPYIYVGDNDLFECSSDLQLAVINEQRHRESCDETIVQHPTALMVRTLNEQCLSLNYAAACKSKHLLGDAACTTIRCGEPAGTHLYNLVEIPQLADDGTFCGQFHVCKGGKCVPSLSESIMYEGFLRFVECIDKCIDKCTRTPPPPTSPPPTPPPPPPTPPPPTPPPPTSPPLPRNIPLTLQQALGNKALTPEQVSSPMLSPILHIKARTLAAQCGANGYDAACFSPNPHVDICEHLICGSKLTYNYHMLKYFLFPPAEGSYCGAGKVCKNRLCTPISAWESYTFVGDTSITDCIPPQSPVGQVRSPYACP